MSSVKEEINTGGNDNIVEASTPPLDKVRKRVLCNVSFVASVYIPFLHFKGKILFSRSILIYKVCHVFAFVFVTGLSVFHE